MDKTSIGASFILASNYCNTKPLSNAISEIFKNDF